MKYVFAALALSAALMPAAHAADVGVSISVAQPGVYGRIDIGRFPQPEIVVAQPVIVQCLDGRGRAAQPVYMWVPAGDRKDWKKHCGAYNACGTPVYFVKDDWYRLPCRQAQRQGQGKRQGQGTLKHGPPGTGGR